jgi:hypothetical protein
MSDTKSKCNANEKVMESVGVEPGQHLSSVRFLELDRRSYEECDRVVVNRAEPWIRNYHLGELCPQDIKGGKLAPAPPGRDRVPRFFPPADQKNRSAREDLVSPTKRAIPNSAGNSPR